MTTILVVLVVGTVCGLITRLVLQRWRYISGLAAVVLGVVGAGAGVFLVVAIMGVTVGVTVIAWAAQLIFACGAVVLGSVIGGRRRAAGRSQAAASHTGPPPVLGVRRRAGPGVGAARPSQPAPAAPPSQRPPSRIFLCYRRTDSSHAAGRLADRLRQRYGHDSIFMDVDSIPSGQNYRVGARAAIESSAVVLVLIGDQWADERDAHGRRLDNPADNVRQEVELALQLDRALPVLIDGAAMPYPQALPRPLAPLTDLNAAPLRHLSWDDDASRLIRTIDGRRPS